MEEEREELEEEKETRTCSCCGRVIEEGEDFQEYDDEIYCQDCFDEEFVTCEDCGEIIRQNEANWIEDSDIYVCNSCFDNNYTICDGCGQVVSNDNITRVANGDYICEHCLENDYYYCEDCNEYVHYSDWNSEHDCCDNCARTYHSDCVFDYHDSDKSFEKHDNGESPKWYIGYELETGNNNSCEYERDITEYLSDKLNVQFERDSSIGATSDVEIISDPQSLEYIYGIKDKMKDCFKYMIEHGYKSHDLGTCGLHFHFSRLQELDDNEVIARGWLILETFKDQIMKISGRKTDDTHYFKWLSDKTYNHGKSIKAIDTLKKNGETNSTRYLAINNQNDETIEFRFNRGTLNFDTFMARLEFTNNLYEIMTNLDKNIEEYSWQDLIKGEYIEKYAQELELENINIPIKDYSIEIIQEQNEFKSKIKKAIKIFTKETYNRIEAINGSELINKDFMETCERFKEKAQKAVFYQYNSDYLNRKYILSDRTLDADEVIDTIRGIDYDDIAMKKKIYKIFNINI